MDEIKREAPMEEVWTRVKKTVVELTEELKLKRVRDKLLCLAYLQVSCVLCVQIQVVVLP